MKTTFPKSVKTGEKVYFKTAASAVFAGDGKTVEEHLSRLHNIVSDHVNLMDLKLGIIGDGIVAGYGIGGPESPDTYTSLLGQHFASYINYGTSGLLISRKDDGLGHPAPMAESYASMDDTLDVILLNMTTNDWYYSVPMGTIADMDVSTYYGALHTLLIGVQTKYPNKEIFVITPLQRADLNDDNNDGIILETSDVENSLGFTLKDYVEVLKEVCEFHAVPLIDVYANSNMNIAHNEHHRNLFTTNGTHLSVVGHQRMYRRIFNEILTKI